MIHKLICDRTVRLGQRGIEEFQAHPFFEGIEWENIHSMSPPYVPEITSRTDTSNFDVDIDDEHRIGSNNEKKVFKNGHKDFNF